RGPAVFGPRGVRPGPAAQGHARLPAGYRHEGAPRARPAVNIVDSSAWLEYFADGRNSGFFAAAIENTEDLIVPRSASWRFSSASIMSEGRGRQACSTGDAQPRTGVRWTAWPNPFRPSPWSAIFTSWRRTTS